MLQFSILSLNILNGNDQKKTGLENPLDSIDKHKDKKNWKTDDRGNDLQSEERDISIKSRLLSFSSNFIAGILLLTFAGYKLDEYLEQENHLYLLLGVLLGIVWSIYETFKLVRLINRK